MKCCAMSVISEGNGSEVIDSQGENRHEIWFYKKMKRTPWTDYASNRKLKRKQREKRKLHVFRNK